MTDCITLTITFDLDVLADMEQELLAEFYASQSRNFIYTSVIKKILKAVDENKSELSIIYKKNQ